MPPSHPPTDAYPLSAREIATDIPLSVIGWHRQNVPCDEIITVDMMKSSKFIDARLPATKQIGTPRRKCLEVKTEDDSEVDLQCTQTKHTTRCKCGNVIPWNEAIDQKKSSVRGETFQTTSLAVSRESNGSQSYHGNEDHAHKSRKSSVFNRLYHYGFKQEKKRRKLVVAVTEERNKALTFSPRIYSPRRRKKKRNKCADSAKQAYLKGQLCGECVMKISVGKGVPEKNRAAIHDSNSIISPKLLKPHSVDAAVNLASETDKIHVCSPQAFQETQAAEEWVEFDESQFTNSIAARQSYIRQEIAAVPSYNHGQSFDCHYLSEDEGTAFDHDECYLPCDEMWSNGSTCEKEIRDGAEDDIDYPLDDQQEDTSNVELRCPASVSLERFDPIGESHEQVADDASTQNEGRFECIGNDDPNIIRFANQRTDYLNEFGEALTSTPSSQRILNVERKDDLHFPTSFQQTESWDERTYESQVSFATSNTFSRCDEQCQDVDTTIYKGQGRESLHHSASLQEANVWDEMMDASQVSLDSSSTLSECDECALGQDRFNHNGQGLLSDETEWKDFLSSCKNTEGIEVMMITPKTKKCLIIVPSHLSDTLEEEHDAAMQNEFLEEDDNPIGSFFPCNFRDSIEGICSKTADGFDRYTCNCGDFGHAWNNFYGMQRDEYKFGIDPFEEFLEHSFQLRMY